LRFYYTKNFERLMREEAEKQAELEAARTE